MHKTRHSIFYKSNAALVIQLLIYAYLFSSIRWQWYVQVLPTDRRMRITMKAEKKFFFSLLFKNISMFGCFSSSIRPTNHHKESARIDNDDVGMDSLSIYGMPISVTFGILFAHKVFYSTVTRSRHGRLQCYPYEDFMHEQTKKQQQKQCEASNQYSLLSLTFRYIFIII